MPWHCPVCSTIIRHNDADGIPAAGRWYRCHVCRLSLEYDSKARCLAIADRDADHQSVREDQKARRRLAVLIQDRRKTRRRPTRAK